LYLNLRREWFKNGSFTPKVVAAVYMTGILPGAPMIRAEGRMKKTLSFSLAISSDYGIFYLRSISLPNILEDARGLGGAGVY